MPDMHVAQAHDSSLLVRLLAEQAVISAGVCTLLDGHAGYTLPLRTVPDHNFIYVTCGRLVWEIAEQPHELAPGEFVVVPPLVSHRGWSKTSRLTFVSVHVTAQLGGQDLFDVLRVPVRQKTPLGSHLDGYFRGVVREFSRVTPADTHATLPSWARLITLEMFRENAQRGTLQCPAVDPVVQMMLQEMEQLLSRRVSLNDLARRAGYSPQHLNRVFRRSVGVTPMKYLVQRKLERAAELLQRDARSVRAISRSLGIDDAAYFSRIFRSRYGVGPAEYRQRHGSENPT